MQEKNNKIKDLNEYKNKKKNSNKRKNKIKKKKKLKGILIKGIGVFSVLFLVVSYIYGNSVVSSLKYEIYDLKKELNEKRISIEGLKAKKEQSASTKEVEEKVKEELNMDYPKEDQIEYVEVKK